MARGLAYALMAASLLAACAPMPVEQAEAMCLQDASLAKAPRGEVAMGIGTAGPRSSVSVTLSSDFIAGRDPSEVYNRCVYNKSGQFPRRPYYEQTHG